MTARPPECEGLADPSASCPAPHRLHASCVARDGAGVLLLGPPGSGKSDLALRLLDRDFVLVADDQVEIEAGCARAPDRLAGLLEVRGLGLLRRPYLGSARLALAVRLGRGERLPHPARYTDLDLSLIELDPWPASAVLHVELALDAAQGRATFAAGAIE